MQGDPVLVLSHAALDFLGQHGLTVEPDLDGIVPAQGDGKRACAGYLDGTEEIVRAVVSLQGVVDYPVFPLRPGDPFPVLIGLGKGDFLFRGEGFVVGFLEVRRPEGTDVMSGAEFFERSWLLPSANPLSQAGWEDVLSKTVPGLDEWFVRSLKALLVCSRFSRVGIVRMVLETGLSEAGDEAIIVPDRQGVVLVIVTTGASDRQAEHGTKTGELRNSAGPAPERRVRDAVVALARVEHQDHPCLGSRVGRSSASRAGASLITY